MSSIANVSPAPSQRRPDGHVGMIVSGGVALALGVGATAGTLDHGTKIRDGKPLGYFMSNPPAAPHKKGVVSPAVYEEVASSTAGNFPHTSAVKGSRSTLGAPGLVPYADDPSQWTAQRNGTMLDPVVAWKDAKKLEKTLQPRLTASAQLGASAEDAAKAARQLIRSGSPIGVGVWTLRTGIWNQKPPLVDRAIVRATGIAGAPVRGPVSGGSGWYAQHGEWLVPLTVDDPTATMHSYRTSEKIPAAVVTGPGIVGTEGPSRRIIGSSSELLALRRNPLGAVAARTAAVAMAAAGVGLIVAGAVKMAND